MKNVLIIKLGDGRVISQKGLLNFTKQYRESIDKYGILILPDTAEISVIDEISDVKIQEDHWVWHGPKHEDPWNEYQVELLAKQVIDGKWGNGKERKIRLEKAGYNYKEIQDKVNDMLGE